ncbi:hypothetical protein C8R45DRAFT_388254 [Mycena sanguinolenta]|nr:hypothetical protein C8R45DRAFT_388254 [Mycena sanguinolenta]
MTSLSPFDLVSQNLQSIGALSINDFLASRYEPIVRPGNALRDPSASSAFLHNPNSVPTLPIASGSSKMKHMASSTHSAPAIGTSHVSGSSKAMDMATESTPPRSQLEATCLRQFGEFVNMSDTLKYELLEEAADTKRCILTITRPDGSSRSYKTEPEFFRKKKDARAKAAAIAIEHGAIDFIVHGDSDELKAKKGVLVAPLDQPIASSSKLSSESPSEAPTARVREIDACCRDWRGDQVKLYWLDFQNSVWTHYGAALKIQLAPHCWRVYSCQPIFGSASEAREHCANLAIDEGVLEFIKHGNGQMTPKSDFTPSETRFENLKHDLQSFYESLPRPLAEAFGEKTAAEINAPAWLGSLLANAKGAGFTAEFYPLSTVDDDPVGVRRKVEPTKLLGCLLRLERPGECRTYLAEPQFLTAKDAKAAVALLALSLGAGKWVRGSTSAVKARVTPEMRRFAQTTLFQALIAETHSASRVKPRFECHLERGAWGCKLEVALKPPSEPGEWVRRYEVPAAYRSKADSKIGVAYLAFEQGVIDLLRNGGQPLAPGQTPAFSSDGGPRLAPNPLTAVETKANKKRKKKKDEGGEPDGPPAKKQKTGSASLPPKPAGASGLATLPPKPTRGLPSTQPARSRRG